MANAVRRAVRIIDFWRNTTEQKVLRTAILNLVDAANVVPFEEQDAVVDRLMLVADPRTPSVADKPAVQAPAAAPAPAPVDLSVAEEILRQLGGQGFLKMTGARRPAGDARSLKIKLPARFAKDRINLVHVTLDPTDTYTMRFGELGPAPLHRYREVAVVGDVHGEDLQRVFTEHTGLDTRLPVVLRGPRPAGEDKPASGPASSAPARTRERRAEAPPSQPLVLAVLGDGTTVLGTPVGPNMPPVARVYKSEALAQARADELGEGWSVLTRRRRVYVARNPAKATGGPPASGPISTRSPPSAEGDFEAQLAAYLDAPSLAGWQRIYSRLIPGTGRTLWQAWIAVDGAAPTRMPAGGPLAHLDALRLVPRRLHDPPGGEGRARGKGAGGPGSAQRGERRCAAASRRHGDAGSSRRGAETSVVGSSDGRRLRAGRNPRVRGERIFQRDPGHCRRHARRPGEGCAGDRAWQARLDPRRRQDRRGAQGRGEHAQGQHAARQHDHRDGKEVRGAERRGAL